jgi:hypothetical protein
MRTTTPCFRFVVIIGTCTACSVAAGLEDLQFEAEAVLPPRDAGPGALPIPNPDVIPDPPSACPSAGHRCVPAAPGDGWTGPLVVYDGPLSGVSSCPSTMAISKVNARSGTPSGGAHTCSACTCGGVEAVTCEATLIEYWEGSCSVTQHRQMMGLQCSSINSQTDRLQVETKATGGSCAPSGGVVAKGAVDWPGTVLACGAPDLLTSGCAVGEVCAPEPAAPFGARFCIAKAGDQACRAPWSTKSLAFGGYSDTRGCTGCSCGAPLGVACVGSFKHDNGSGGCNNTQVTTYSIPTTGCINTDPSAGAVLVDLAPSGGSCSPAATSTATGDVIPTDPTTVCCFALP